MTATMLRSRLESRWSSLKYLDDDSKLHRPGDSDLTDGTTYTITAHLTRVEKIKKHIEQ